MFHHRHCDYLGQIFSGPIKFANFVEKIRQALVAFNLKTPFTHIAVSGVSGIAVGAVVCLVTKKNLIIVRKPIEYSDDIEWEEGRTHSSLRVEGIPIEPFNYIVLDDLVCSGRTVRRITESIIQENPESKRVGIFTYESDFGFYEDYYGCCGPDSI